MSPYSFRVYRDYEVGLGDVVLSVTDTRLENGDLQIKQIIDNNTKPPEKLNFECNLYIPFRKRMQRTVTKLSHGRDTQIYIISGADSLRGQELHLRAQQIGGQRVLNQRFRVGENWDNKKNGRAEPPRPNSAFPSGLDPGAGAGAGAGADSPFAPGRPRPNRRLPTPRTDSAL